MNLATIPRYPTQRHFFGDISQKIDLAEDPAIQVKENKGYKSGHFAKSGYGRVGCSPHVGPVDVPIAIFGPRPVRTHCGDTMWWKPTIAIVNPVHCRFARSHDVVAASVAILASRGPTSVALIYQSGALPSPIHLRASVSARFLSIHVPACVAFAFQSASVIASSFAFFWHCQTCEKTMLISLRC
jgi:hypothetical protein